MQELLNNIGSYSYSPFGLPMALVGLLALSVGVWVVIRERGRRISLSFLAVAGAVGVYLIAFSFMVRSEHRSVALFWAKVAYLGAPFIVPALYQFSMELLGLTRGRILLIRVAWAIGVINAAVAVLTDALLAGVVEMPWGFYTDLTAWAAPFLIWSITLTGMVVGDYLIAYLDADPVQRARIRWLAFPLVVGTTGFIDYLPSLGLDMEPWGFVGFSGFLVASVWVVSRYHLPDLTPAFAADKILATMAEPLFVVNELGRVAVTNGAAARLLGWSQEEMDGERLTTLLGEKTTRALLGDPELRDHEIELMSRGGQRVAVAVSNAELVVKGRVVGTVVVARDIRERRRAAEQLRRREQHFRALIENARDTITILDARGRVIYQSPSHKEVLGRRPAEGVGSDAFKRVHPDDREPALRVFRELVQDPGGTARITIRMAHSDGGYRAMDLRAQNLLQHPAVRGVVVNGRDVTDEQELAERLQQAQKLEAIGQLAGGIAHDFNNVLTTIQGNLELLAEEGGVSADGQDRLDEIRDGAERAARLTDQLLSFSRRQMTQPSELDISRVVSELAPWFETLVAEADPDIELRFDLDPEAGRVRVDRGKFVQALKDLAINAVEAMDGPGRIEIATTAVELEGRDTLDSPLTPGRYVRIVVSDTGRGMNAETQQRLFEPFFSTKEPGSSSGLGLATVYGSIRQASGHITVESEPGDGTRMSILLPRRSDEPAAAGEETGSGGPALEAAARAGEPTVLVVEDEGPVRGLITKILRREGYHLLEAADGEEALEVAAGQDTIDLLIADLVMPGLTGREVAERLAADDPELAIILISGYTADEVVRDGISKGDYEFLPKPFTPSELKARVATVLGGRAQSGAG